MIRFSVFIVALSAALFSAPAFGGEASKTGVVKGTIAIAGKPATDVVVSIEGVPQDQSKAQLSGGKAKAVMNQKDLKFIPRVLPVVVGTTVDFPNNDKTFHNVFSNSDAKKFDLGLYPSGQSRSVTFDKAGVVKILCNAHPHMEAYIVVKNHRYFSVADSRGNYTLSDVPLGKYRIEVWHPQFGTRTVPVELVRQGEVLAINVDLKGK
jgi:plastocyanin